MLNEELTLCLPALSAREPMVLSRQLLTKLLKSKGTYTTCYDGIFLLSAMCLVMGHVPAGGGESLAQKIET